ncbi:Type I restriction enzyme EcoR124II R protein [Elizabethkingia miricola]|nr:Type I restriction enzyme EcoR124II R protein [Elizabethkingia miricola]
MIVSNDNKYRGQQGASLKLDEYTNVELPFIEQLKQLGWDTDKNEVVQLQLQQTPEQSYRTSFSQVLLIPKLKEALETINPFLTSIQVEDVIRKISLFSTPNLIENNEQILHLLLENTTVGRNEKTGELSPVVKYIDFENPQNNIFTAISQFKINIAGTEKHIIPDIVLFINGIPLVVVEAKSAKVKEPIDEAIDQLLRYSEQREANDEGCKELFYYNQFVITTCRTEARFGTITTHNKKHFYRWTDPYPFTLNDLAHGQSSPNDQQRLVAGMLAPQNLLDIIRIFTVFQVNDKGHKIKVVGRYQQFRAVKLAIDRLLTGKNNKERGGIIWHTQGSGKSLTMMFLVRQMKLIPKLMSWKIVFVTDRTQLESQLSDTGKSIGFNIKSAEFINPKAVPNGKSLKELLSNDNSDMIMAMIHKFQENGDLEGLGIFPLLNQSPNTLIMTDEAHRSQFSMLAANLDRALPNATSIGFTGTPTDKTEQKYKDYIDKYTMREAIDDGVTLEIVYEGLTHNAEVEDKEGMDAKFEDVFSDYNLSERLQILGYGTKDAYMESETTIRDKANHMVEHYLENIFTNGFKAQIVANSREAAVMYKTFIDKAIKNTISKLEEHNPMLINIEMLKNIETAVVISGSHNDKPHIKAFTNNVYHKRAIKRFKLPFDSTDEEDTSIDGNVGFIIVNNMLLTGFDAPIEQVMYLDRIIVEHNLLQTIARVNRVGPKGKDVGFIVDYVGVGHHLKRALDNYAQKEQEEIIACLKDDKELFDALQLAYEDIWEFLKKYGLEDFEDTDAFFDTFYDEDIRYEFIKLFNKLTTAFNNVLPDKKALDYFKDYKSFAEINNLAQRHFLDERFSMKGIPPKLRKLVDEFLLSKGIEQTIEPISIISDDFQKDVRPYKSEKSQAAQVEHAIRHFIDINLDEDPELFASFSKQLEDILEEFRGNWRKIYEELLKLREKIKDREKEVTYGLDRKKQMPFFRIFKKDLFDNKDLTEDEIAKMVALTQDVSNTIATEIRLKGFWNSVPAQNKLKEELKKILISKEYFQLPNMLKKHIEIISRLLEHSKKNHFTIIG